MRQKSTVNVTQKCSMAWLKTSSIQGCVIYTHVEEPSDPWHPTLALSQAENLIFFTQIKIMLDTLHVLYLNFHSFRACTGIPSVSLEHSLVVTSICI